MSVTIPVRGWRRSWVPFCLAATLTACTGQIAGDGSRKSSPSGGNGVTGGETTRTGGAATGGSIGAGGSGVGGAGGAGGSGPGTTACNGAVNAGPSRMHRITRQEYNYAVEDLLGEATRPADGFTPDETFGHFSANVTSSVTLLGVEDYMTAAEKIAAQVAGRLGAILPCHPLTGDEACARAFIAGFASRAYARPLASDELDALLIVFRSLDAAAQPPPTFVDRIGLVMQAVLQSPDFLYRAESAPRGGASVGVVPLTSHELARRLSFALWSSVPDVALMNAATSGALARPDAVQAEAARMMADPKFLRAVDSFHSQWLGIRDSSALTKDPTIFPAFTPELAAAAITETKEFIRQLFRSGDARLSTLLSGSFSYVNPGLAKLYGVPYAGVGTEFVRTDLPPAERAGILTHASVLAAHSHANQTSPVRRGIFVLTNVLCAAVPPAPPTVNTTPPDPDPKATTRERFHQHVADPVCANCHRMMDPIGFGFEGYDATGRFRSSENGKPLDVSGDVVGTRDVNGPFNGALELVQRLRESEQARSCMSQLWLEFALQRMPAAEDGCSVEQAHKGFAASDYNLRELILAVVKTDAFRHSRTAP